MGAQPLRQSRAVGQEPLHPRAGAAWIHQQVTDPPVGVGGGEHAQCQVHAGAVGVVMIGGHGEGCAQILLPALGEGEAVSADVVRLVGGECRRLGLFGSWSHLRGGFLGSRWAWLGGLGGFRFGRGDLGLVAGRLRVVRRRGSVLRRGRLGRYCRGVGLGGRLAALSRVGRGVAPTCRRHESHSQEHDEVPNPRPGRHRLTVPTPWRCTGAARAAGDSLTCAAQARPVRLEA